MIVIGGGNVAIDVARSALRLGVHTVRSLLSEIQRGDASDPWRSGGSPS